MEKPSMITFSSLAPIIIQKYERYLPTAFDESLTLLEKVNKVIDYLNKIGKLSEDVVNKWNEVMEWVLADGLTVAVNAKLESMVANGTLAQVINIDLFNRKAEVTFVNEQLALRDQAIELKSDKTTVEETYSKKIKVNPKDFGAIGDGQADDTQAIKNAIQSIATTGGTLQFPVGIFKYSDGLVLPNGVSIEGVNGMKTTLYFSGVGVAIRYASGTNWVFGTLRDFRLLGTNLGNIGIYLETSHEGVIERVNFEGFLDGGISLHDSWSVKIDKCRFSGMKYGVKADVGANALYVTSSQFANQSEACVLIGYGMSVAFDHCNFELSNAGIKFIGGWLHNLTIRESYGEGLDNGVFFVPSMSATDRIFGLHIENMFFMGLRQNPYAININTGSLGGAIRNANITNLDAFNCVTASIRAIGGQSRLHLENCSHFDFDTWQELPIISADSAVVDITRVSRGFKTLNFDEGEFSFSNIVFKNVGSLPSIWDGLRGKVVMVQGGSGVADQLYIAVKNSADGYEWKPFIVW